MTPIKGMETLIHSLLNAIDRYPESSFYFNSPIQDLDQVSDGRNLILCTPAPVSAQIIGHRSVELAQMLKSITYLPLLTATVFIRREDLPRNPRGLGILVPSKEKRKVMGMLMNSSSFDERLRSPDEFHSFTLFFGGSRFPEVVNLPDDKIHEIIRSELDYLLSFKTIPAHTEIVRWKQALPLYNHHLRRTWQLAKQTWCKEPGNLLFGNYTGAISIRGMIEACAKI